MWAKPSSLLADLMNSGMDVYDVAACSSGLDSMTQEVLSNRVHLWKLRPM